MKLVVVPFFAALALVLAVVLAGIVLLVPAFLAMLLLGSLHASYLVVPALGFWTTWKILWLTYIVGGAFYNHNTTTKSD